MILFNNNFSSPITKTILSEYFTTVTNPNVLNPMACYAADSSGNLLYQNSTLVPAFVESAYFSGSDVYTAIINMSPNPKNFQIVTEKFLRVLDKVYTKIWNESFTETGIYNVKSLVSLYTAFSKNDYTGFNYLHKANTSQTPNAYIYFSPSAMRFSNFVARCITAGVLDEADRLTSEDQIFISQPNTTISTSIDTVNSIITFSSNSVIDIQDFNTKPGSYLNGKKLYLLMTPFIANASTINPSVINYSTGQYEPVGSSYWDTANHLDCYSPWGFFKPKTDSSKFGASIPLATHLFWRIGTPEDKEIAILEGTEVPEIIFDHLDQVSHIDTFQLKVKYGPIQFD